MLSPIEKMKNSWIPNCDLYIKREDLISFSFGGNKARKGLLFFEDILEKNITSVVTYGSSSSNHCRVISNLCAMHKINCYIVTPPSNKTTNNTILSTVAGAIFVESELNSVANTIEKLVSELENSGETVYFIQGGGHGNIGTQAYVNCYEEILAYENEQDIVFDRIVFASGTGTTQAGLICGAVLNNRNPSDVLGISIARENEYGSNIIRESVELYLNRTFSDEIFFDDTYLCGGYGKYNNSMLKLIEDVYKFEGIPLDSTYTCKAFYGMVNNFKENNINKNILFIHTGGAPLFFNNLEDLK